jgi:sugar lactone lactonase YvrE
MIRAATALIILILTLSLISARGVRSDGGVILTDDTYRVSIFGTSKDGFASPDGLLWYKGKLYLADEGGASLEAWNKGEKVKTLCDSRIGILSPEDLVADNDGNIYFTDDDAGGLWLSDTGGTPHLIAGKDKGLISTEGIALSPQGTILVGDGVQHEIFSVTKQGIVSIFLGPEYGISKPESMVYDEQGNLYIADNHDNIVYLLDTNHKLHTIIDARRGLSPETIFYHAGTLYITDSHAGKVCLYTPMDGLKTLAVFGGKLKNVQGITVDAVGDIYVTVQTDIKRKIGYVLKIAKENP